MRIWPAAAAVLVLALTAGTAPAAAVVVDAEGIVSEIAVTWGRASSFWK
jgi:hypothetical protein